MSDVTVRCGASSGQAFFIGPGGLCLLRLAAGEPIELPEGDWTVELIFCAADRRDGAETMVCGSWFAAAEVR